MTKKRRAPKKRTLYLCPDCRHELEASVHFDCDIDPVTGQIGRASTGGSVDYYCSEDCGWRSDGNDICGNVAWPGPMDKDILVASDDQPDDAP